MTDDRHDHRETGDEVSGEAATDDRVSGAPGPVDLAAEIAELRRQVDQLRARVETGASPTRPPGGPADGNRLPTNDAAPDLPTDRRGFLRKGGALAAGALAGGAALVATAGEAAAAPNYLIAGANNNAATTPTGLAVTGTPDYGFGVSDNGLSSFVGSAAVAGHAKQAFGYGIFGLAEGYNTAVGALSASGNAVGALSTRGVGVRADGVTGVEAVGDVHGISATADAAGGIAGYFRGWRAALFIQAEPGGLGSPPPGPPPERTDAHAEGEVAADLNGDLWWCAADGTPGTWRKLSGPATAGSLHVLPSTVRVYDSRSPFPPYGGVKGALGANQERVVDAKTGGAAPAGAVAVLVNLTIVSGSAAGFLSAFKNGITWPGTSSVNWDHAGQATANSAVVAVDGSAQFKVRASNPTDYVVDVIGYYR